MAGIYWLVPNDGADWRCETCDKMKSHKEVIQPQHTETKEFMKILCLECVDEDWFKEARNMGMRKLYGEK